MSNFGELQQLAREQLRRAQEAEAERSRQAQALQGVEFIRLNVENEGYERICKVGSYLAGVLQANQVPCDITIREYRWIAVLGLTSIKRWSPNPLLAWNVHEQKVSSPRMVSSSHAADRLIVEKSALLLDPQGRFSTLVMTTQPDDPIPNRIDLERGRRFDQPQLQLVTSMPELARATAGNVEFAIARFATVHDISLEDF